MGHFAKVENDLVTQVIVAEPEFFDTFTDSSPGQWIQCSYNSTIRKNYPSIGHTYDSVRDAFYVPKLYSSWTLNETTCQWEPPVACPDDDKFYTWNEKNKAWDEVE